MQKLDESCRGWLGLVEEELTGLMCLDEYQKRRTCGRAQGPKFVMKPALGPVGSCRARVSHSTEAWRTAAAWLLQLAHGFAAVGKNKSAIEHSAMRARYHFCAAEWKLLGTDPKAMEFRQWYDAVTYQDLRKTERVQQLLCVAHMQAQSHYQQD